MYAVAAAKAIVHVPFVTVIQKGGLEGYMEGLIFTATMTFRQAKYSVLNAMK